MPDLQMNVFVALLAAGQSSRFGSTKQTVGIDGIPMVQRALATAAEVCGNRVITVIGHDWESVLAACAAQAGFVVMNENYKGGLGTSIAAAARACCRSADALVVLMADQPLVTAQHLRTLVERWSGSATEIVASAYDGTEGPPVLFPRETFAELGSLGGDKGARALLRDPRFKLRTVPLEAGAVDIDTPMDLARLSVRPDGGDV